MDLQLDGVVALVVGGTGVLGSAVARRLHAEGAQVVLAARSAEALAALANDIGGDPGRGVGHVRMDTLDQASVDAAVAEVVATYGAIGVLVTTAAPSARTLDPARDTDPDAVAEAVAGKALGYLRVTNAVLPQMLSAGFGRVVAISGQNMHLSLSVAGATRNVAVLTAVKVLADRNAGTGVTLNVVNPGLVTDEPSTETEHGTPGDSTPQDSAALVAFLASPLAGAISGETVAVGHKVRGIIGY